MNEQWLSSFHYQFLKFSIWREALPESTYRIVKIITLRRHQCGTNEVEKWSRICGGQMSSHTRSNDRKLVNTAMKMKIEDAKWNAKAMKKEFLFSKSQYRKVIRRSTMIDLEFQKLMRFELENLWHVRKLANQKKVRHLLQKWRTQSHPNGKSFFPNDPGSACRHKHFARIEWTQFASRMYVFYLKLFEKKYSFDLEVC